MQVNRLVVGDLETNCYILINNNKCLIIDPGDEYEKIKNEVSNKEVVGVIITHHHFDHIGALNYFNKSLILDKSNLEEKEYDINGFKFEVIYTPGHKEDSITIYFKEQNIMFTGDFIFKGTIGRMDLEGGNALDMKKSLDKLKKYDGNIKIYPGHGESTYLYKENLNIL
ncbi:MAG: MBL fold metallo-hydrolase [Firmicutes bacterium]|nr:MBL fold metallo-hydrolase [Bacillota bacterium]